MVFKLSRTPEEKQSLGAVIWAVSDDRGEQGFAVFLHVLQNVVRFPFGIERLEDFQRGVVVLDDGIGVCCTGFAVRPAARGEQYRARCDGVENLFIHNLIGIV